MLHSKFSDDFFGIIFDLDGTLVDSAGDITDSIVMTLNEFNLHTQISAQEITEAIGFGIQPLLKKAVMNSNIKPEIIIERFSEIYSQQIGKKTKLFDGMQEVLDHFKDTPKAILTNKRKRFTDIMVQRLHLEKYFTGIYSKESFERHKPDPLPILRICEIWNCRPAQVTMIGDTFLDIDAAGFAKAQSIAVEYGYGKKEELKIHQPTKWAKTPLDLIALLETINATI